MFLEQAADKILNTGKYLNVVRLCGKYNSIDQGNFMSVKLSIFSYPSILAYVLGA